AMRIAHHPALADEAGLSEPAERGLDIAALFAGVERVEPAMGVAVATDMHAGRAHLAELAGAGIERGGEALLVRGDVATEQLVDQLGAQRRRQSLLQHALDEGRLRAVIARGPGETRPVDFGRSEAAILAVRVYGLTHGLRQR